jgi:hypothetical protein
MEAGKMISKIFGKILCILDILPVINEELFPVQGMHYDATTGAPNTAGLKFSNDGGIDMVAFAPDPLSCYVGPAFYARRQDGWYSARVEFSDEATSVADAKVVQKAKLDDADGWKVTDLLIRIFVDRLKPNK